MSKLRWLPKSPIAWGYFAIVYGILFPWFAICFFYGEVIKGGSISPLSLRLQVVDLFGLLWLPPLFGIGTDLLVALWTSNEYKLTIQKTGFAAILRLLYPQCDK
jgi:hypothetical protein